MGIAKQEATHLNARIRKTADEVIVDEVSLGLLDEFVFGVEIKAVNKPLAVAPAEESSCNSVQSCSFGFEKANYRQKFWRKTWKINGPPNENLHQEKFWWYVTIFAPEITREPIRFCNKTTHQSFMNVD